MNALELEKKWQKKWKEENLYSFDKNNLDNKYYLLEMFSYPSGSTLHLGHWFNYSLSDSFGRFKSMQGFNVFHPMGFDAFGLPAENYALKTGIHPRVSTYKNMDIMKKQLADMGATYDWKYTLATCDEDYYKWSQWLFIKLFEKGLAYQKHAPVNWCPSCNTVLANEQVVDGNCERCGTEVIKKEMTQWFFKITDYAERLLNDLDKIDWPEKTKIAQRNWIGKSTGTEVDFKTESGEKITVFTSRVDTLHGVSWIVLAPEHKLVSKLTSPECKEEVDKYVYEASKKDEITRQSTAEEKTGVFIGNHAIHPLTGQRVPIYISDYVLATYATGAVMGVAAHDERDFDFAKKYGVEIVKVIDNKTKDATLPFTEHGVLVNSGEFDGLTTNQAKEAITDKLISLNAGRRKVNYKLRDWSVSRQRYWGCPIPIIYDENKKPHAATDLPVTLPDITDYKPKGTSPLGQSSEYMNTTVPGTNKPGTRDADTLDTFICSSWYFLRYPSANNSEVAFDKEFTNKMLPVDKYVGGMEHATGHLLYSRFITKFLFDEGYISFDEPFNSLIHQGMILGADGQKMSKSKGNTINLDEYIEEYGSDALRLYLAFGFKYIEGGPWNDAGIKTMSKFLARVARLAEKFSKELPEEEKLNYYNDSQADSALKELEYVWNNTVKECISSMEDFSFNTAVARIMELVNAIYKYELENKRSLPKLVEAVKVAIKLLAPFAPHNMEELWSMFENSSIHKQDYPTFDESKLVKDEIEIAVQVNSKIVSRIMISTSLDSEQIYEQAIKDKKVAEKLEGKNVFKKIVIPARLINIIAK